MSKQPSQIEQALTKTEAPQSNRRARDLPPRRGHQHTLAIFDVGHGAQDDLGAIHLPRQRVAG
jgi:hypothetical protein